MKLAELARALGAEDKARLDWPRSAARDAFDAIDRQEGTKFSSIDGLADFINQTGEKLNAERKDG
jgi:hypothetical protein